MSSQVEASTIKAGAFFANNRFLVPDFQRKYSWRADEEISDFWNDISRAIHRGEYFLGLVILSEDTNDRREVVDGQQRMVTLTILANVLRLSALELERRLIAESIRTDFLYSMDFKTEEQVPRVLLTDEADAGDLAVLLKAKNASEIEIRKGSPIHDAHVFFSREWGKALAETESPALLVGQWTEFLTKFLTFAVFIHPDRGAAFRVYEVVNTRGLVLTPSELIKSFLIGNSEGSSRDRTYSRWRFIEEQIESAGSLEQLTTFVRHVVTLDRGYVIPRNLYDAVSKEYGDVSGTNRLLERLEEYLPTYMQMLDPSVDVESSEVQTRAFAIADKLSTARFRPILLAASKMPNADELTQRLMQIVVPGALTGTFGTGSVEAQFARSARRVQKSGNWEEELNRLGKLKPSKEEFVLRLERNVNRQQAHVLLSAFCQETPLPTLSGFAHQVRPRNVNDWEGFNASEFRDFGGLIGNWIVTKAERRPQGTRSYTDVRERLLRDSLTSDYLTDPPLDCWPLEHVQVQSKKISGQVAELWYER